MREWILATGITVAAVVAFLVFVYRESRKLKEEADAFGLAESAREYEKEMAQKLFRKS